MVMLWEALLFVSLSRPSRVLMLSCSRCRKLVGYRAVPSLALMLSDLFNVVGLRKVVMARSWRWKKESWPDVTRGSTSV